jgi:hypothetical protein
MDTSNYTEINSQTIDRWIEEGWKWGIPITPEQYAKTKNGEWSVGGDAQSMMNVKQSHN